MMPLSIRRAHLLAIAATVSLLYALGLTASSAYAVNSYQFSGSFSAGKTPAGGNCEGGDLDIDRQENVYVVCGGAIKKFNNLGSPVNFTGTAPYISGNTIIASPAPNTVGSISKIAIDRSTGPDSGIIYVQVGTQQLVAISPDGTLAGILTPSGPVNVQSLGTDPFGNITMGANYRLDKRNPAWTVTEQLYAANKNLEGTAATMDIAFDSTGAAWVIGQPNKATLPVSVYRYEADQFIPAEVESQYSTGIHKVGKLSGFVPAPLLEFEKTNVFTAKSLTVDLSNDTLLAERLGTAGIVQFSRGTPEEESHQITGQIGTSAQVPAANAKKGIAISPTGTIYAANNANVSIFKPGPPLPSVRDHQAQVVDLGHTSATVRARIELEGSQPVTSCEVKYGPTKAYGNTAPCTPNPAASPPASNFTTDTEVSASLSNLLTGSSYHFAFLVKTANGTAYGVDRVVRPVAVLKLDATPATEVTDHSATLNGSIDPDGMSTEYHFEYGLGADLTDFTPTNTIGGSGEQSVSVAVNNLNPGSEYSVRIVATNSLGTTAGPTRRLIVSGPPAVAGVQATSVTATEADLNARINPGGFPTTYHFEYGVRSDYEHTVPAAPVEDDAGEGTMELLFTRHVDNLVPGNVYHFRLVATNKWGTTRSGDTTFNFFPQPCPNERVRQQTKAAYLPDCRAYEIVSPEDAGGALIYPGDEIYLAGSLGGLPTFKNTLTAVHEIQNTGLATGATRFNYFSGLGAIGDLDAPNIQLDSYTATRTDQRWVSSFSGVQGREHGGVGRKACSTTLDTCMQHFLRTDFNDVLRPINWAYYYDLQGNRLGILPSNVETVPNGKEFIGDLRASSDYSHFVFSSRNVAFAPGGLTQAPGSVYDNDLRMKSVTLVSKLPNGDPIPLDGNDQEEFIILPTTGISRDGSHILMQSLAADGPAHLYMRVNDLVTYDVSEGSGVKFLGMTEDGSKVLFSAGQRLAPEDTDNSADLYEWDENGGSPKLTVLSQGEGQGDSDACNANWTDKCSVTTVETERGDRTGLSANFGYKSVEVRGPDSKLARDSGGIYFFSPETLAGAAPKNGKNLYLANKGQIHYVATISGTENLNRIQISADGEFAGFVTSAKLTSYENAGFREMYVYSARSGRLECASCLPSGAPPTVDVAASQNGPFMSDDGRPFFTTSDRLVPADVDVLKLPDVYEYVDGRPQLISSGKSANMQAAGGAGQFATVTLGLESVSSDGRDVFFSTTDTLVPQDRNGDFAKIYDARTNGGFEVQSEPAACVAADECHGAGAATPAPLQVGTGSSVSGGNLTATKQKKSRKKRAKSSNCRRTAKQRRRSGPSRAGMACTPRAVKRG